jgi:hypothetical protein
MKRSLFAAAIAVILLAAGCQKTEIMNQSGSAIGFESVAGKLTKAEDAAGLETLKTYGFRVWVYRNFEDEYYAGEDKTTYPKGLNAIYDGMEGLEVKWNTYKADNWGTAKDYYWPGTDKSLKFYAVSCNESDFALTTGTNASVVITNNDTETGTTTVNNFVVKADANNDLMIAAPITQAQGQGEGENKNAVKPVFSHTLTKVQFNFKTDANTVKEHPVYIQNIKTSALKTTGTITLPFTATTGRTSPWTLEAATLQFEDDNTTEIKLSTVKNAEGEDVEITVDGEGATKDRTGLTLDAGYKTLDTWLLLPQDISSSTVTITYIIKDRQFEKTFPLYTTGLTEWDANQFVKYNVTIAPNLISFDPSVEEWDNTDVTVNDSGVSVDPTTPSTPNTNYVEATTGEGDNVANVTLYYTGELAVGNIVYTDQTCQTVAATGTYTLADTRVLTVGEQGKVTNLVDPQTPEVTE